ncbi:MAG: hypothetical protein C0469_03460 [Cyanobacteria bacterium DS2.3.42]|nr:hypothetical protein [Cyanobacteria bacterium DS2.3.42]
MLASASFKTSKSGHVFPSQEEVAPMNESMQIEALVAVAKKLEDNGAIVRAEQLYRQTVNTSEFLYGAVSPITGLAVLELMSFCENHNNRAEAANLWKRLRVIVLECE